MRAAPASSPIPCSTLNAPSGRPASCAMSASIEAVSGAHSGGLRITALPAASAGATRQVASINGAFHGVITAVTPLGSHSKCSANPSWSFSSPSVSRWSAKNRKFRATRGMTEFRIDRSSEPLSRVSTAASSGTRASTPSAIAVQDLRSLLRGHRAPDGEPLTGGGDGRSASAAPPRATSAMGISSIGETSTKVSADATRVPPIQWSVETSMPSTTACPVATLSSRRGTRCVPRSFGHERYGRCQAAVKPQGTGPPSRGVGEPTRERGSDASRTDRTNDGGDRA